MQGCLIDAGVLAIPKIGCSRKQIYNYIEVILDLNSLADEKGVTLCISESVTQILFDTGLYPLRKKIRELFDYYGISEFDANTAARAIDRLVSIVPSFEQRFKIFDVLAEKTELFPDIFADIYNTPLKNHTKRCLSLICILKEYCFKRGEDISLFLKAPICETAYFKGLIYAVDHSREELKDVFKDKKSLQTEILLCNNLICFIKSVDEASLLADSKDIAQADFAIRVALFKNSEISGKARCFKDIYAPPIGKRFLETAMACCADQPASVWGKIMRAILETANKKNMDSVHPLRYGHQPNKPPILRGKDKAMRRDIDRQFHLHYWDKADGTIELASIVYHNDFSIP